MAQITAAMVAELRQRTGAGMMDSKKALTEADGNMDEAVTILRKRLGNKVSGRGERTAAEGIVMATVTPSRTVGVLVEMNSETDFVARNEDFKALTRQIVDKVAAYGPGQVPKNTEELLADASDGRTLADVITDAAGRIGEKIQLGRFERFGAPDGNVVGAYVHNPGGSGEDGGKIGVLVEATGADPDALATLTRELALHIASANPMYLNEADVEQGILDKEREIARDQATSDPKMAGKPEKAIESMVEGRVRKFLEGAVLLNQAYVRDPAKTVGQIVKETAGASIVRFVRFRVGEQYTQVAGTDDTEGGHKNSASNGQ
jgi:elongation factor Ts